MMMSSRFNPDAVKQTVKSVASRAIDRFKDEHGVKSTPQTFINGERVGAMTGVTNIETVSSGTKLYRLWLEQEWRDSGRALRAVAGVHFGSVAWLVALCMAWSRTNAITDIESPVSASMKAIGAASAVIR